MDRHCAHVSDTATAQARVVSLQPAQNPSKLRSLIDERFDHDSCGVGFVASIQATATHTILEQALTALGRLAHRGATAADGKSSDGVGVLAAVPSKFLIQSANIVVPGDKTL